MLQRRTAIKTTTCLINIKTSALSSNCRFVPSSLSRTCIIQPNRASSTHQRAYSTTVTRAKREQITTLNLNRLGQLSSQLRNVTTMASKSAYTSETPEVISSAKGLHLITQSTPNGQKVQIFLEELKAKYGLDFTYNTINIGTNEQKRDYFLRLNPNGRIPVIVDNTVSPPHAVHETSAELLYLQNKYDKDNVFGGFTDPIEQSELFTWLFFWHGSGAPYQGQLNHFNKAAPEKIPYAIKRYRDETWRVFGVLEIRLSGKYANQPRDYLAGHGDKGTYTIADITTWPWVKNWEGNYSEEERAEYPHLARWIARIAQRDAVKIGISDKYASPK